MTADTRSIIQSIIDSDNTFSGQIVADIPNMNSILKRLEPMALPSASPLVVFLRQQSKSQVQEVMYQ